MFVFQHPEAKKIVRNYNKMAGVLMEYEVIGVLSFTLIQFAGILYNVTNS